MVIKFFSDMNIALSNKKIFDFRVFIFTLYNVLDRKVLNDVHDLPLYRASKINKEEYEKIINSSHRLVLTHCFLSFSKDKNFIMQFERYLKHWDNTTKNVLFVVNPLNENKDSRVTNIDTENLSFFPSEKEVLFLPFSGFEISRYEEKEDYLIIYLNYLNRNEKKIKDYIDAQRKDKV